MMRKPQTTRPPYKEPSLENGKISLAKTLSNLDVLALGFGAMIGFGWVVLTDSWLLDAGTGGAAIAFIVGGFIMAIVGLTYSELTAAMPKAGGAQNFILRAMGPHPAFIGSWAIVGCYITIVAFEAVAIPNTAEYIFPGLSQIPLWEIAGFEVNLTWALVGVGCAVVLTWINILGVKVAGVIQTWVVIFLLIIGIMLITGAFVGGEVGNMEPWFTPGVGGFFAVMVVVPFMYVGFDVIPQSAEEVKVPPYQIGKLVVISVMMATAWYVLVILASSSALPLSALESVNIATADAMGNMFNSEIMAKVLIAGGIAGILTSWNSLLIGASRMIFAMGRTGMIPAWFAKLHPKYKTPINALLLIGVLSAIAPFFGHAMLGWAVDSGSPMIVITYILVSLSFVLLRKKEPDMARPMRVGGSGNFGVVIGIVAVVLCIGLFSLYMPGMPAAMGWQPWIIFGSWWILGAFYYYRLPKGVRAGEDIEERLARAMRSRERQRITSTRVEKH